MCERYKNDHQDEVDTLRRKLRELTAETERLKRSRPMPIDKSLEDLQRLVKAARIVGRAPPHEYVRDIFGVTDGICFFCGAHEEDGHDEKCAWVVFREVTGG